LRAPATLDALAALAKAGRIKADAAAALAEAYRLLRTIEHRLQMVDDRQTHSLPADGAELDNVARLHDLANGAALLDLLRPHVERVASIYDTLDAGEGERLPAGGTALDLALERAGFAAPEAARARIEGWRSGKVRSLRTNPAREAFEAMLPVLIRAFGAAPDPMGALNRFDDLILKLPTGVNFYRLLEARPALIEHLAAILSHAPALAEQLGRRPELLDGLLDASAFAPAPGVEELTADVKERLGRGKRLEQAAAARDAVLEALLEKVSVPLPETMVTDELNARRENVEQQLMYAGLTMEKYLEDEGQTTEEFEADLDRRVRDAVAAQFILDAIAKKEEIGVDQQDLSSHLVRRAQQSGQDPQEFANHMFEHNHIPDMVQEILRGKALATLVEAAVVKDASGNVVELANLLPDGSIGDPAADVVDAEAAADDTEAADKD